MVAAILGLVAFLAFTFGIASSRLDARKELLRNEANAIETPRVRAMLLAVSWLPASGPGRDDSSTPDPGALPPDCLLITPWKWRYAGVRFDGVQAPEVRMSVNTIERILWELGDEPARVKAFLKDPDGYLAQFQLTEDEFRMVRTMDVKALGDHGVSNLLTMMSWLALHDNNQLMQFDYLRKMNRGELPNNMKLPGWQFNSIRFALWVRSVWVGALCFVGLKKSLT